MTIATSKLTLTEFLAMPETKPASEYINGAICPKPMPKTRHSRLQSRLIRSINGLSWVYGDKVGLLELA